MKVEEDGVEYDGNVWYINSKGSVDVVVVEGFVYISCCGEFKSVVVGE